MTQRDWQKDFDFCRHADKIPLTPGNVRESMFALIYWLQEAKMLRDTIEMAMNEYHLWQSGDTPAPMMYGILQEAMSTLYPDTPAPTPEITARPIDEWHEDFGDVLWWEFPIEEPPYCGTPLDMDWPEYHTHWTPIVIPAAPAHKEGE